MNETTTLSIQALYERVEALLIRAGLDATQASALARVIVAGERDACKSHGIYRIEGVLRTLKAGKVVADAMPELIGDEATAIVRVDAKGGFANPALSARARACPRSVASGPER
ncbi:hypothetical protein F4V88_27305 [Neorhizobium galegae]|nr:hypothetical protein F4V88_27305 [Neorhizobium galegae]